MTFVSEHLATLHRRRSCTEVEDDTFIEHSAQKKILHRSRRWPRTDVEDHYCFKKLSFFYLEKYPSEISSSFSARSKSKCDLSCDTNFLEGSLETFVAPSRTFVAPSIMSQVTHPQEPSSFPTFRSYQKILPKLPKVFQKTPKSSTEFRKDPYNKDSSEEVNFRRQSLSGLNTSFIVF